MPYSNSLFNIVFLGLVFTFSSALAQGLPTPHKVISPIEVQHREHVIDYRSNASVRGANITSDSRGLVLKDSEKLGQLQSDVIQAPITFESLGLKWEALTENTTDITISVSASKDANTWTKWQIVSVDADMTEAGTNEYYASLIYFGEGYRFVKYKIYYGVGLVATPPILQTLRLIFINPGKTPHIRSDEIQEFQSNIVAPLSSSPTIVSRTNWGCTDGQSSPLWTPQYTTVTHLITHHTDTTNIATDWPAQVRSIWTYHTYTRNWGDIGYNYLIDPNGVIYEGRAGSDNVIGAHFSCQNSNTMGVALLGTYSSSTPTAEALASLENLYAWKVDQEGIDPLGTTYHPGTQLNLFNISGHRDGNSSPTVCNSTVCPGDVAYNLLPNIRNAVNNLVSGDTTSPTVDWFQVSPQSLNLGSGFFIYHTVSDSGGSQLNRVELWRANDSNGSPSGWALINEYSVSGNGPHTDYFYDVPNSVGLYWYGIHVVDNAGNLADEGGAVQVSVLPSPPTVTTNNATSINQTSATFDATVNPNGASTTVYYDYGTTTSMGNTATYGDIGSGSSSLSVPLGQGWLNCGTTYYYRARAVNNGGETNGATLSFTTSSCPQPQVDLVVSYLTGSTSANAGDQIPIFVTAANHGTTNSGSFLLGLYLSADNTITTSDTLISNCSYSSGLNAGASANCSGNVTIPSSTTPGTYYFGAIIDDLDDVSESDEANNSRVADTGPIGISAVVAVPSVTTYGASSITETSATFNATVNPNGASTTIYYDYGTTTSLGGTATYGNIGSGTSSLSVPLGQGGLNCGATYYYRARAVNSEGSTNGSTLSFTTSTCLSVPDGDINNDGQVNPADLFLAIRILKGHYIPNPAEQARWDVAPLVNGIPTPNQQNDMGDFVVLQRKVLGVINF